MYQVFVNGALVYDTSITANDDIEIINPLLHMAENDAGSFTFVVPKKHYLYSKMYSFRRNSLGKKTGLVSQSGAGGANYYHAVLRGRTDQITIYKDGKWLWEGCPIDAKYDLDGNLSVECVGAYAYLEDVVIPLKSMIDRKSVTYSDINNEARVRSQMESFAAICLKELLTTMLNYYNDRISEIETLFDMDFSHKKIYFGGINNVSGIKFPPHFSRVCNFENVKEAIEKRILDDFGGYVVIRKNETLNRLELFYSYNPYTDLVGDGAKGLVSLGRNLLDYNINEDFTYYTSVVVLGDPYDENHPGDSVWWYKNPSKFAYGLDQRANLQWRDITGSNGTYYPQAGCRLFIDSRTQVIEKHRPFVERYGFKECILEYEGVVARYPSIGWANYAALYGVNEINPDTGQTIRKAEWASIDHYMGYNPIETTGGAYDATTHPDVETVDTDDMDLAYRTDYMLALKILGKNFLESQQFGNMILEVSATELNAQTDEKNYFIKEAGQLLRVSNDILGENLLTFTISELSVALDDEASTTITLGGSLKRISGLITST